MHQAVGAENNNHVKPLRRKFYVRLTFNGHDLAANRLKAKLTKWPNRNEFRDLLQADHGIQNVSEAYRKNTSDGIPSKPIRRVGARIRYNDLAWRLKRARKNSGEF